MLSYLWLESKVSKGTFDASLILQVALGQARATWTVWESGYFDARASHIWQYLWSLLIRVKGVSHLTQIKNGLWLASKVIKGMVKYGLWHLWHMAKAWCKGNFSCSVNYRRPMVRNYSSFSADQFNSELLQIDWMPSFLIRGCKIGFLNPAFRHYFWLDPSILPVPESWSRSRLVNILKGHLLFKSRIAHPAIPHPTNWNECIPIPPTYFHPVSRLDFRLPSRIPSNLCWTL